MLQQQLDQQQGQGQEQARLHPTDTHPDQMRVHGEGRHRQDRGEHTQVAAYEPVDEQATRHVAGDTDQNRGEGDRQSESPHAGQQQGEQRRGRAQRTHAQVVDEAAALGQVLRVSEGDEGVVEDMGGVDTRQAGDDDDERDERREDQRASVHYCSS